MEQIPPELIKVIGICVVFLTAGMGAVILALLDHQRKMAAIMRSDRTESNSLDQRVDALQGEIRELKTLISASLPTPPESESLRQRVS